MPSAIRKTGLLIAIIVVLPVLVFSVFEIGSFRHNEKIIQDIYKNQLDAILFSINQYSDDVMSNLAFRIETHFISENNKNKPVSELISEMPAVVGLMQFNTAVDIIAAFPDSLDVKSGNQLLVANDSTIKRLQTYLRGGYRKIETLKSDTRNQWMVFLTEKDHQYYINLLIIDAEKFVTHVLNPKMQQIAGDRFYIAAYKPGETAPFYSTDQTYDGTINENKAPFWLLRDYKMGIKLTGLTIDDLTRSRMRRNFILIGILDAILLLAAIIIFLNIKKQMELSQLKSDFVSGVSHEIRTPLALISMYIETLEMGRIKSQEKVREYYNVILTETTRLSGIVNRILNFSQIENNKRKFSFSSVSLNDIAETAINSFKHILESKGFTYTFEPTESLPPLLGDHEAISDAVNNLIDNAIKYSKDNKVLYVRTGIIDAQVYLEVQDQGIGISTKHQRLIFDKFFRVSEKNLANSVKGSGLGLAIVKNIMVAHKGDIMVKSNPGEGSLFRLLFPYRN